MNLIPSPTGRVSRFVTTAPCLVGDTTMHLKCMCKAQQIHPQTRQKKVEDMAVDELPPALYQKKKKKAPASRFLNAFEKVAWI